MIGLEPAEEAACRPLAGLQPKRRLLERRQGVLVLEAGAGQPIRQRHGVQPRAGRQAMHLQGIGRVAHRLPQRADQTPGVPSAHREVLARRQHPAVLRVGQRGVVEVVADVVLVEPHRAVVSEPQVLGVDEVERHPIRSQVLQLDMPEPGGGGLRQGQAQGAADAAPVSRPAAARLGRGDQWGRRAGAEQRRPAAKLSEPAQIEVDRTALQRIAEETIE